MAVQQNRKTRSKTGMRRAHLRVATPAFGVDPETGERHRRHHLTAHGYYRGRQVIQKKVAQGGDLETSSQEAQN